jgi:hypothetical protein
MTKLSHNDMPDFQQEVRLQRSSGEAPFWTKHIPNGVLVNEK